MHIACSVRSLGARAAVRPSKCYRAPVRVFAKMARRAGTKRAVRGPCYVTQDVSNVVHMEAEVVHTSGADNGPATVPAEH